MRRLTLFRKQAHLQTFLATTKPTNGNADECILAISWEVGRVAKDVFVVSSSSCSPSFDFSSDENGLARIVLAATGLRSVRGRT
jgi:hypothetical protein